MASYCHLQKCRAGTCNQLTADGRQALKRRERGHSAPRGEPFATGSYAFGRREVSFRWSGGKLSAAESLPFADGKHSFRTAQGGASLHKTQENPHKALALCGLRMHTRERDIYARRINFAVNGRLRASS